MTPESQHNPGVNIDANLNKKFKISFGQIYLAKPMMTESDGETGTLFPKEARLRNLTCAPASDTFCSRGCDLPLVFRDIFHLISDVHAAISTFAALAVTLRAKPCLCYQLCVSYKGSLSCTLPEKISAESNFSCTQLKRSHISIEEITCPGLCSSWTIGRS